MGGGVRCWVLGGCWVGSAGVRCWGKVLGEWRGKVLGIGWVEG